MGYCSVEDLRRILPEKVQIGDQNIGRPVPGRSGAQSSQRSNISPAESEKYILYANQYIDGRLRPYYSCPLRRIKSFETDILSNVSPGTDVVVEMHDTGSFIRGDLIRLQNKQRMETAVVKEVNTLTELTLESVQYSYNMADDSKISILEYPDPIPIIAARLACSFILDRLFVSEQSPDVSSYGRTQRNLARNAMDDILAGEILLFGREHTGRRFVRGTLLDRLDSPALVQKGEEKE